MNTNSETGHAKNVANFEQLVLNCTSYGRAYNPGNPALSLEALNTLLSEGKQCLTSIHTVQASLAKALSEREVAFEPFSKLATRIANAVRSSASSPQADTQVIAIIRKLQGRRAAPKMTEEEKQAASSEGKEVVEISASQMSFTNRIANFDKLIELLKSIREYTPNESDLTVTALTTYHQDLTTKNQAVINAEISVSSLRITRNNLLYKETTGMIDVAAAVKTYIKSVFGATSPQYKQISSLKFVRR
ncbi:MAG: hypothetical protein A2W90_15870 [Bacteroidetes bacterium GWF2_42_66]|nr:MAG: hypothetical protein A2W89_04800 [Bacteroidetes bacterium GWE2_42_39]OFY46224.1 MAG: hypothetical protein A2W90_15870 [Bacteroidetes bacterium GWF2_42_66]HBL78408.1 hypothetical protein [Prolixibacteraceae bacterium]HCU59986.1 hypothetical protein [Prolixibacteraceae bacterium]